MRCTTVTLAEVCRGPGAQTASKGRSRDAHGGQRVLVVPTNERLAKLVGAVLHTGGRSSQAMADAHVVAVCAGADTAFVMTSDIGDVNKLAMAIPGTRIIARRPEAIV